MKARENPFGVQRIEAIRYLPIGIEPGELPVRLEGLGGRGAIVGPEGSGKTRLLEELEGLLRDRGVSVKSVFVNDSRPLTGQRCKELLGGLQPGEVVLVDGADSISRARWFRLKRGIIRVGAGLVVTSHRSGLLPTLVECEPTAGLFREIVGELLEGRQLEGRLLDRVYERHRGNIREALCELYDLWAGLAAPHAQDGDFAQVSGR